MENYGRVLEGCRRVLEKSQNRTDIKNHGILVIRV